MPVKGIRTVAAARVREIVTSYIFVRRRAHSLTPSTERRGRLHPAVQAP